MQQSPKILITGSIQAGKTSYLSELVKVLKEKNLNVGGFLAPGSFESGERSGFRLKNILTGLELAMASTEKTATWIPYRRFWFNPAAFESGRLWIKDHLEANPDVIVIDEVGPMELEGSGWIDTLEFLNNHSGILQLWSVRENLVEEVLERWNIPESHIIRINRMEVNQAAELICTWTKK